MNPNLTIGHHETQSAYRMGPTAAVPLLAIEARTKHYLWSVFISYSIGGYLKPVSSLEASTGASLAFTALANIIALVWLADVASNWNSLANGLRAKPRTQFFFYLFLTSIGSAAAIGLLNVFRAGLIIANIKAYLFEASPMIIFPLAILGTRRYVQRVLPSIIIPQIAISMVLFIVVLWRYPTGGDRSLFGGPHYTVLGLLTLSVAAIAMLEKYSTMQHSIAIAGYMAFGASNIIYESRGGFIVAFCIIPAFIILSKIASHSASGEYRERRKRTGGRLKTVAGMTVVSIVAIVIILVIPSARREFESAFTETMGRLYGGEGAQSIAVGLKENTEMEYETSRGAEAKDYLKQIDVQQLFIGNGFAGTWYSDFWGREASMVHFGPLHLVLKGGIVMLIAFVGIVGSALGQAFTKRNSDEVFLAAAAYILAFVCGFVKHGPIAFTYDNAILWLLVGFAISNVATQRGLDVERYYRA